MKRTDDFLTDLEAQLGAAAAGRLRRRRRAPARVLRPLLVTAMTAAALTAFVLAATTGGSDPERAADAPPTPGGAPFTLPQAERCAIASELDEPPHPQVLEELAALRRAPGPEDQGASRRVRAEGKVSLVPMQRVGECAAGAGDVSGVCAVVELGEVRTPCFTLEQIRRRQAAAALENGFLIAVLPDGVWEVTLVIGDEHDTYRVTDNVVVANLEGAEAGARLQIVAAAAPQPGCGSGTVEDGPLPGELLVALPVLEEAAARLPDQLMDRLAKAGANRVWLGEARRLPVDKVGGVVWVVPVADARFAECADPLVTAPRAFEGPGACLVASAGDEARSALCADLDDLLSTSTLDLGEEQLVFGFLPHWAVAVNTGGRRLPGLGGVFAGRVPSGQKANAHYLGEGPPRHLVEVVGPQAELASRRLAAGHISAPVHPRETDGGPTRVWYAPGMVRDARRVAELLRVEEVLPMDPKARALAGEDADVLVLAGDDLRP